MVEHWMRQNAPDEVCLLVVENNDQAKRTIRDVQIYHRNKNIAALLDDESRKHFPLRKIKEDPLFQEKQPRSALQLPDFFAYVFKKFLMQDRRYDPFVEMIWPKVIGDLDGRLGGKPARSLPRSQKRQSSGRSR
jgi:hypothetical protein